MLYVEFVRELSHSINRLKEKKEKKRKVYYKNTIPQVRQHNEGFYRNGVEAYLDNFKPQSQPRHTTGPTQIWWLSRMLIRNIR